MKYIISLVVAFGLLLTAHAELSVLASTAYTEPDFGGVTIAKDKGITGWKEKNQRVLWFGEIKTPGKLSTVIKARGDYGRKLRLTVGEQSLEATIKEGEAAFGEFEIAKPGYVRFELNKAATRRGGSGVG